MSNEIKIIRTTKKKRPDLSLKFAPDPIANSMIAPINTIVEAINENPVDKPRPCPKGTRRNKKTGKCEEKKPAATANPSTSPKDKRCSKGTRKNKTTGICEPVIESPKETVREPVRENSLEAVEEPVREPTQENPGEKLRPCPKGTRRNKKTGKCEEKKPPTRAKPDTNIQENPVEPVREPLEEPTQKITKEPVREPVREPPREPPQENPQDPPAISNKQLLNLEKRESDEFEKTTDDDAQDPYDFLYPDLNDPHFNEKIAQHKEFADTKYDGSIHDIKKQAAIMCNAKFELMPHQIFVKNFLSLQTPYNSLLLYHGLGSGKTCSAIGIAEEMRAYMKQLNITQRILIVASPNVQTNFRLQLFDERKLKLIPGSDGLWNIESCVGNSLLKEINPTSLKGMTQEKVISAIKRIINQYYLFIGYGQLSNYIFSAIKRSTNVENMTKQQRKKILVKSIRELFDNRLIIIDEVHNIRLSNDNKEKKKTALLLMQVAKHSHNMRMLLLSATPLFNSYKEIIWLVNLMNINDKRATIEISDVFDTDGHFKESGRDLLIRKMTGYISYIRGENPYTFPFRIYPETFAPEHTFKEKSYPTIQMNGNAIDEPIKHIHIYTTTIGEYQKKGYEKIMNIMKNKTYDTYTNLGKVRRMPTFENMESFGYTILQHPIESLNMVYPNAILDAPESTENNSVIESIVGKSGLDHIMKYTQENQSGVQIRYNFEYKPDIAETYGEIFSESELPKYSAKIAEICRIIKKSKGIVAIYSQYIDGGVVPVALALESMGFTRFSSGQNAKNLFKNPPKSAIDALTMNPRTENAETPFHPAKYVMITGDKSFSPNNAEDIKYATNADNKRGEKVRVILLSKAGAEGLDFKNIRQVHVLEPWYNMNRIEQIIGRGVRNLSHCGLPFEDRNVEIYLHGTELDTDEEAADLYVYRLAEKKAIQIGNVTRLMKSVSVDCLLNIEQTNFTMEKLNEMAANQKIKINVSSSNMPIEYKIGDRPFTEVCDYMEYCDYKCIPKETIDTSSPPKTEYYNTNYLQSNQEIIMRRIRELFREKTPKRSINPAQPIVSHVFYERNQLIAAINIVKEYPYEQIYSALSQLINNPNEYLVDAYGRTGRIVDKYDAETDTAYYAFQPIEITDDNASIFQRSVPVEYKRRSIFLKIDDSKGAPPPPPTTTTTQDETEASMPPVASNSYEAILKQLETAMKNTFNTKVLNKGEKEWYVHAGMVVHYSKPENKYTELQKTKNPDKTITVKPILHSLPITQLREQYKITDADIKKYMVEHFIDVLPFQEKMTLIQYLYNSNPATEYEKMMKAYFDQRILQSNELVGITIMKDETLIIMIKHETSGKTTWKEADEEDYEIIGKELLKYVIPRTQENMNELLGFVTLFTSKKSNTKEMVFKIKDMTEKRNNFGARIDEAGKDKVVKILNKIVKSTYYTDENTMFISQLGLCIVIEILMRHFSANNGKYYYLTPEQMTMSEIIKKSFA
jgi:Helicase conserved C-terminal domain